MRAAPGRSSMTAVIVAGSIVTAVTLGVRATMGLFPDEIDATLGVGIDTVGLTVALQNLIWGLGQPLAGAIADRFGSARVLLGGALTYAAGLMVMAGASGPLGLYLGGGFVTGFGMSAASFAIVLAAMGKLVDEQRRSVALGTATAFGSFGHFVLVPLAGALIGTLGWRTTLTLLAIIAASIVTVMRPLRTAPARSAGPTADLDVRDPSASAGHGADEYHEPLRSVLSRAGRHRGYLRLNCAFFVCGFHVTFVGLHLPKSLTDAGLSSGIATLSLALIGLTNIFGAFGAGLAGARIDKSRLLIIIYCTRAVLFAGLVLLPATPVLALGFGLALGVVWLASVPLTSGIVLGQFGARNSGTLFGFVFLSHQLGAFGGAYGAGLAREITGSYDLWWWLAAALAVVAAVLHFGISEHAAGESEEHGRAAPGAPAGSVASAGDAETTRR